MVSAHIQLCVNNATYPLCLCPPETASASPAVSAFNALLSLLLLLLLLCPALLSCSHHLTLLPCLRYT